MNDTEEAARRLFAVAAEDVPPGIDLLHGVRTRSRRRVVRSRSLAAAGAAGIVAAVTVVTLSAGPAPSAFAQVKQAAIRTAEASYMVRSAQKIVAVGGLRSVPWSTAYGEFDVAHGVGEQTDNLGHQIRYVGGAVYVFLTSDLRADFGVGGPPVPAWASWKEIPNEPLPLGGGVTPTSLGLLSVFPGVLDGVDPQDLLALLQSATGVRAAGPASGPGWTGSAYTFTITTRLNGPMHTVLGFSGTVDVDQQGRVRQLAGLASSFAGVVSKVEITFGDFGLPVSVSPPPASEVWIPPGLRG